MATHLDIIDFDEMFRLADHDTILLVNDLDATLTTAREILTEHMVSRYNGDALSVIPTCVRGCTTGGANLGKTCPVCMTKVEQSTERVIESTVWMKAPEGTAGFIHPTIYTYMKRYFVSEKKCLIDWLCRLPSAAKAKESKGIARLKAFNFKRGLNAFAEDFDRFLEVANHSEIAKGKSLHAKERLEFINTLKKHKDKVFCQYLPLPSKVAFVIEDDGTNSTIDANVHHCIDAATTILTLPLGEKGLDLNDPKVYARVLRRREDRAYTASVQLAGFYESFIRENLGKKPGWYRKHVCGGRLKFSFRGVITSIYEPHCHTDVHLPWLIGVNLFALHISNRLLKMDYSPREISRLIAEHTNVYHPLLDKLMHEIIADHPKGRWPIMFQRNPILARLSNQNLYVSKVKTNPEVRSISLSVNVLKGFNADFDGDEMNGIALLDKFTSDALQYMEPQHAVLDHQKPRQVSGFHELSSPFMGTLASWINEPLKL